MIKINLALKKQASYASDQTAKPSMFSGGTEDLQAILLRVFLPLLICVGLYYGFDFYTQGKRNVMQTEYANFETERAGVLRGLEKIKGFERQRDEMRRNEDAILVKINTVEALLRGRDRTVKELITIAQSLPKEVWLSDIEGSESRLLKLRGNASELNLVSDIMTTLSGSIYFKGVNLVKGSTDTTTGRSNFEITARRE